MSGNFGNSQKERWMGGKNTLSGEFVETPRSAAHSIFFRLREKTDNRGGDSWKLGDAEKQEDSMRGKMVWACAKCGDSETTMFVGHEHEKGTELPPTFPATRFKTNTITHGEPEYMGNSIWCLALLLFVCVQAATLLTPPS